MKKPKILQHIYNQPFIVATGLAALVHSTWALGTLFSGPQPDALWHLAGWLLPALLIAFALDVGQIATSWEIRAHGLTVGRGVTFFVFAAATYYLQWLYIAHHMPALEIAAGVSATAKVTAISMRDAALWVIPAFLPLSTVLYTFSGKNADDSHSEVPEPVLNITTPIEAPRQVEITAIEAPDGEGLAKLPFGSTVQEPDALENSEKTESMPISESVIEPIGAENKPKKRSTRRIQAKE